MSMELTFNTNMQLIGSQYNTVAEVEKLRASVMGDLSDKFFSLRNRVSTLGKRLRLEPQQPPHTHPTFDQIPAPVSTTPATVRNLSPITLHVFAVLLAKENHVFVESSVPGYFYWGLFQNHPSFYSEVSNISNFSYGSLNSVLLLDIQKFFFPLSKVMVNSKSFIRNQKYWQTTSILTSDLTTMLGNKPLPTFIEIKASQIVTTSNGNFYAVPDPLLTSLAKQLIEEENSAVIYRLLGEFFSIYKESTLTFSIIIDNEELTYHRLNLYSLLMILASINLDISIFENVPVEMMLTDSLKVLPNGTKIGFLPLGNMMYRHLEGLLGNVNLLKTYYPYVISASVHECLKNYSTITGNQKYPAQIERLEWILRRMRDEHRISSFGTTFYENLPTLQKLLEFHSNINETHNGFYHFGTVIEDNYQAVLNSCKLLESADVPLTGDLVTSQVWDPSLPLDDTMWVSLHNIKKSFFNFLRNPSDPIKQQLNTEIIPIKGILGAHKGNGVLSEFIEVIEACCNAANKPNIPRFPAYAQPLFNLAFTNHPLFVKYRPHLFFNFPLILDEKPSEKDYTKTQFGHLMSSRMLPYEGQDGTKGQMCLNSVPIPTTIRSTPPSKRMRRIEAAAHQEELNSYFSKENLSFVETENDGEFTWKFTDKVSDLEKKLDTLVVLTEVNRIFDTLFTFSKHKKITASKSSLFPAKIFNGYDVVRQGLGPAHSRTYADVTILCEDLTRNKKLSDLPAQLGIVASQIVVGRNGTHYSVPDPLLTALAKSLIERRSLKDFVELFNVYLKGNDLSLSITLNNQEYTYHHLNIYTFLMILVSGTVEILDIENAHENEILKGSILIFPNGEKKAFIPFERVLARTGTEIARVSNQNLYQRFNNYFVSAIAHDCLTYYENNATDDADYILRFKQFCHRIREIKRTAILNGTLVERENQKFQDLYKKYYPLSDGKNAFFIKDPQKESSDHLFQASLKIYEEVLTLNIPAKGNLVDRKNLPFVIRIPEKTPVPVVPVKEAPEIIVEDSPEIANTPNIPEPVQQPVQEFIPPLIQEPVQPSFAIKLISEAFTEELELSHTEEVMQMTELAVKQSEDGTLTDLLAQAFNSKIEGMSLKARFVAPPPQNLVIKIEQSESCQFVLESNDTIDLSDYFEDRLEAIYKIIRTEHPTRIQLELVIT